GRGVAGVIGGVRPDSPHLHVGRTSACELKCAGRTDRRGKRSTKKKKSNPRSVHPTSGGHSAVTSARLSPYLPLEAEREPDQTVPRVLRKSAAVRTADYHERRCACIAVRRVEVGRVAHVKAFRPELHPELFSDPYIAEQPDVQVDDAGRGENTAVHVADIRERS